jgi:hypothetical protein
MARMARGLRPTSTKISQGIAFCQLDYDATVSPLLIGFHHHDADS